MVIANINTAYITFSNTQALDKNSTIRGNYRMNNVFSFCWTTRHHPIPFSPARYHSLKLLLQQYKQALLFNL